MRSKTARFTMSTDSPDSRGQHRRLPVGTMQSVGRLYECLQASHPREYAVWKKLDRDFDGYLSHAEIRAMCLGAGFSGGAVLGAV